MSFNQMNLGSWPDTLDIDALKLDLEEADVIVVDPFIAHHKGVTIVHEGYS